MRKKTSAHSLWLPCQPGTVQLLPVFQPQTLVSWLLTPEIRGVGKYRGNAAYRLVNLCLVREYGEEVLKRECLKGFQIMGEEKV